MYYIIYAFSIHIYKYINILYITYFKYHVKLFCIVLFPQYYNTLMLSTL